MTPAAFQETAAKVAREMTRQAMRAALNGETGQAARSYMTDSGVLYVEARFDGEALSASWAMEGQTVTRASAESHIAARLTARMGGQS